MNGLADALAWNVCLRPDEDDGYYKDFGLKDPTSGENQAEDVGMSDVVLSPPRGVDTDAMEATLPRLDQFDEDDVNQYEIGRVIISDRHTLYMMPNCECGINEPAFMKWVDLVDTNAGQDIPTCPVAGCGADLIVSPPNPLPRQHSQMLTS